MTTLFFDLTSVDAAVQEIASFLSGTLFSTVEIIPIEQARGRILAEAIVAPEDVPNFEKSTVDGYAVRAADTIGASDTIPALFAVDAEIKMGEAVTTPLQAGRARRIPTGGMLPPLADAAVMLEHTERLGDDLFVKKAVASGANTIRKGEDIKERAIVLEKGTRLRSGQIGALATLSIKALPVYALPRFCILSSGDEIRPLDMPLKIAEVRDSNAYVLKSQIEASGGRVAFSALVKDDLEALFAYVQRGAKEADIVLVSGGSSVGEKDYTKRAFQALPGSRLLAHGLKAKPGKPTIIATAGKTLLLGLPGHPASCHLIFQALIVDAFRKIGLLPPFATTVNALLTENCHGAAGRRTYQAVRLEKTSEAKTLCHPLRGQSGLVSLLAKADGFIEIPENEEGIKSGSDVSVQLLEY